ncbi:MAG: hypothetical protein PHD55_11395 [Methanoregula sp.]|nr:hypothetical protein [Methanoregula sp.]
MKNDIASVSVELKPEDLAKFGSSVKGNLEGMTATITPISDRVSPTFNATRVLQVSNGPDLLVLVTEIRRLLLPYESKVFAWLNASPDNARQFIIDPVGSLKKMNVELDQDTWAKINRAGELIKKSASAKEPDRSRL